MLIPVILSGGSGTRLWPLSRELYPKQLLPLTGELTMLQETARRTVGLSDRSSPIVVCNESHRFLVAEQLQQIGERGTIILEPVGRNTAPAIALAALQAEAQGDDPCLLVLPADHAMTAPDAFRNVVTAGLDAALAGKLVTFGIVPDHPATGYGYIRRGEEEFGGYRVEKFVEKPDRTTAEDFLTEGTYSWNSGMFLFRAKRYLEELELYAPAMLAACRASFESAARDLDFLRVDAEAFAASPSDSIDYAVMEKTDASLVYPMDAGWSDVGSWDALWSVGEKDERGNLTTGDVQLLETENSLIHAESRLVATIGLRDLIVVETADAVLVADRNRSQEVKKIVDALKCSGREEHLIHRRVHRPWGAYQTIDRDERFQVKRITVNPGASLSLQKHHHRAEHWVVVSGTAEITRGDEVFTLGEDESTYIPLGVTHRLHNPGRIPLEMIEVQSGSYLGEDDIVRYEDTYGRQG